MLGRSVVGRSVVTVGRSAAYSFVAFDPPLETPERPQETPGALKRTPRSPEAPKRPQEAPKRPKEAPGLPPGGLKRPRNCPPWGPT